MQGLDTQSLTAVACHEMVRNSYAVAASRLHAIVCLVWPRIMAAMLPRTHEVLIKGQSHMQAQLTSTAPDLQQPCLPFGWLPRCDVCVFCPVLVKPSIVSPAPEHSVWLSRREGLGIAEFAVMDNVDLARAAARYVLIDGQLGHRTTLAIVYAAPETPAPAPQLQQRQQQQTNSSLRRQRSWRHRQHLAHLYGHR